MGRERKRRRPQSQRSHDAGSDKVRARYRFISYADSGGAWRTRQVLPPPHSEAPPSQYANIASRAAGASSQRVLNQSASRRVNLRRSRTRNRTASLLDRTSSKAGQERTETNSMRG